METENLIKQLADQTQPVKRLPHPLPRTVVWFMAAMFYGAIVAFVMGLRADLPQRFGETRFVIEVAGALLTSMMAAAAAFCAGCPGRPLWERFAPLPFLALWLGSLGQGCWQDWMQFGEAGLRVTPDLVCLPIIAAISVLPGAIMFVMIRAGAPIAPVSTAALGTLAVAALSATVLRLTHLPDASIMVLLWQVGSVAILTLVGALLGHKMLPWPKAFHEIASD